MSETTLPEAEFNEEDALPEADFSEDTLADEMPDFDDEDPFDVFDGVDPASIITIRPSTGEAQFVVTEEPIPFSAAMQRAGLTFNGQINIYREGAEIGYEDLVQGGQTITVIGNVKGGVA